MSENRQTLIDDLVADLAPVRRTRLPLAAAAWFLASWAWVVASTLVTGPIRPGALGQLASVPHFALESLTGLVAGALVCWAAFSGAVPGASRRIVTILALTVSGLWIASHVFGLIQPALEPSMLGKRSFCFVETLLYAGPPLAAALWIARRGYVLHRLRTAVLLGLSAGMLPALFMQIACMYVPSHILLFHLLPGGAIGVLGGLASYWLRPRGPADDNPLETAG